MAKVTKTLNAVLTKNISVEKGGAWLLTVTEGFIGSVSEGDITHSAWSNPSAAKRYLKAYVQERTPRKSIKMAVLATTPLGKPSAFAGDISWKVDA
jgi:hypothetical protein